MLTRLPTPIIAKTLDCWAVMLALANAAAAFCAAVDFVGTVLAAEATTVVEALPFFLGCISQAAFCAAAKSSERSAW